VGYRIDDVLVIGCKLLGGLFQLDIVIADQIGFTQSRQTGPQGERPQPRLFEDRLTMLVFDYQHHRRHEGDFQSDNEEDKFRPEAALNEVERPSGKMRQNTPQRILEIANINDWRTPEGQITVRS
jgi:hypothetical protein